MTTAIFVGVLVILALLLLSLRFFLANRRAQVTASRHVLQQGGGERRSLLREFEAVLAGTAPGRWLRREMTTAGLSYPLWAVVLVTAAVAVTVPWLLWVFVAPIFAVAGVVVSWFGLRWWLGWQRTRYRDKFVNQIPDLARVLSNATNAGLSIRTAWAIAEREMGAPASTEIARMNTAVRFGASMEEAMNGVEERLPSREVKVLMSTLVIASRSGGSLVAALRDISYMLDERKETKREVRSTIAQAVATGYTVTFLGVGLLFVVNLMFPGTIERMTQNVFGVAALVIAGTMILVGWLLIRRITRLDL